MFLYRPHIDANSQHYELRVDLNVIASFESLVPLVILSFKKFLPQQLDYFINSQIASVATILVNHIAPIKYPERKSIYAMLPLTVIF